MRFITDEGVIVMKMIEHYSILSDAESKSVPSLVAGSGATQYPVCWDDYVAHYIYLVGQGRIEESQKLLVESLASRRPIEKILEHSSSPSHANKFYR